MGTIRADFSKVEFLLLEAALEWAAKGIPVFPVREGAKAPPLSKHGYNDASTDPEAINTWWRRRPNANIATPTGKLFDAVDIEPENVEAFNALGIDLNGFPLHKTARGGLHIFGTVTGLKGKLAGYGELKGRGGSIHLPPSRINGREYVEVVPLNGPLLAFPQAVVDLLVIKSGGSNRCEECPHRSLPSEKFYEASLEKVRVAEQGERNNLLNWAAYKIGQWIEPARLNRDDWADRLLEAALENGSPSDSSKATIESGLDSGMRNPHIYKPMRISFKSVKFEDETTTTTGAVRTLKQTAGSETEIPSTLPDEFWNARDELQQVRRAAHNRGRSADAVLGSVLTRVAAGAPVELRIPPIVGTQAPLTLYAILVGPPGMGKGSAYSIGCELLPLDPEKVLDQLPLGTGEGLAEAFYDWVTDENGESGRKQAFWNGAFYADEGQVMTAIGQRSGSTLLATLRTAFTGGPLGQTNASSERRRLLRRYTIGLVAAFQDELIGPLLDDAVAGTPQRFLWLSAIDPAIPDRAPAWPEGFDLGERVQRSRTMARNWRETGFIKVKVGRPEFLQIEVPETVRNEVRRANLEKTRGKVDVALMQAHADLLRLKIAACLAVLADRDDEGLAIDDEDWQLATMIKATSDGVLANAQSKVKAAAARREHQTSSRLARRKVEEVKAIEGHRIVECARRIREKVKVEPGITVADLRRSLPYWRDMFSDGLAHAITEGWVDEKSEPGQGAAKRALYPHRPKREQRVTV